MELREGVGKAIIGVQGLALLDVETELQLYVLKSFILECNFPTFDALLDSSRFPGHILDFSARF
jgi:hypothetical protein